LYTSDVIKQRDSYDHNNLISLPTDGYHVEDQQKILVMVKVSITKWCSDNALHWTHLCLYPPV